ncbi:polar amino acid ABC transporter, inner membrane subunit [Solidesulfovibrio carbinoliphilus subsp. oakridgensis]|uniref:Polar amino acid ABC transporter, inner membrane subunit n=1 Tax=Solidesulfovibrio carbinoliphilus subsp. oakridgensis TaxID=694327 RepID=G7QBU9_9BACT|nr:amino acid ABC transporter permease [Solidesulfovibrio carbinoliphilus]EHJ49442.1 polar amino acid ABC transporter, inner membrane subunit [Solidesulfovibrio carbinoliphilus subsp. oakridgensis]
MDSFFEFAATRIIPALDAGLWTTILLIVPASLLGMAIGVTAGTARVYGPRPLIRVLDWYVAVFRGTPLVVQLYFWYFALPNVAVGDVRLVLPPMWAAIIGFALCSGAYQSEYIRGGLLSIKRGQLRAAQALGMTPLTTVTSVVLPQAFRRALPGCGNEIIYLIKYSSLASIITVNDLTGMGRSLAKSSFRNTEVFVVVGLYYLALVTVATFVLRAVEKKLEIPGFEGKKE